MHALPSPVRTADSSGSRAGRPTLAVLVTASFFVLLLCASHARPSQGPQILLDDGYSPITEHQIGNHLFFGLWGAVPGATYSLELRDENGWAVAATRVVTNQAGYAEPVISWEYSGFHCEPCPPPGSCPYLFSSLEEAETALAGRTFTARAVDTSGALVASTSVPLVVRTTVLVVPADDAGCSILTLAKDEDLFVAGDHLAPGLHSMRLWVVDFQIEWHEGDPLSDVRRAFQDGQVIPLEGQELPPSPAGLDPFPVSDFCLVAQMYDSSEPPLEPFVRAADLVPGRIQCVTIIGAQHIEPWGD